MAARSKSVVERCEEEKSKKPEYYVRGTWQVLLWWLDCLGCCTEEQSASDSSVLNNH